ncbi:MAG: hypothetical protein HFF01_04345 [Erysipelotrichaceae bacterium]|nr:hypothetical protein [Erysipelotrichaceae bacterium]MCI9524265.1 hypothetical protein [Erysipelotrichaceae bacterium]
MAAKKLIDDEFKAIKNNKFVLKDTVYVKENGENSLILFEFKECKSFKIASKLIKDRDIQTSFNNLIEKQQIISLKNMGLIVNE